RRSHRARGRDPRRAHRLHRGAADPAHAGARVAGRENAARRSRLPGGLMDFDSIYRDQRPRALATLIRLLRDFDLAEDMLQEAFAAALVQWPGQGLPGNPCAWLVSAARHKAIDHLRRERNLAAKQAEIAYLSSALVAAPELD